MLTSISKLRLSTEFDIFILEYHMQQFMGGAPFLPQYFSGTLKLNSSCKFLTVMQFNFAYDAILPKLTLKSPKLVETEILQ